MASLPSFPSLFLCLCWRLDLGPSVCYANALPLSCSPSPRISVSNRSWEPVLTQAPKFGDLLLRMNWLLS